MRHSQVLPGYPHSSAGANNGVVTCQLLGSTMQTEATACESCHVRIGTYRSPLWLWPTMGQPQKLASIGSQAYVCIQIQSTQGTPQKYPTGVVWGVCVGCVWGEQWSGVCVKRVKVCSEVSPFPSVSHFLSVWGTHTWVCYSVTMATYNQMTNYKAPEFQPARNNLLPDTQH